jgi:hypothetical protein
MTGSPAASKMTIGWSAKTSSTGSGGSGLGCSPVQAASSHAAAKACIGWTQRFMATPPS